MNRRFVRSTLLGIATSFSVGAAGVGNALPDFSPLAYSYRHRTTGNNKDAEEIDLGTTLVAIKYGGGVVVGADTRTSAGGYVSNKLAFKINPIFQPGDENEIVYQNDDETIEKSEKDRKYEKRRNPDGYSSCVLCRSGSAADTQWLANQAKRRFRLRKLERPGYRPTISEVAHFLRYHMRNHDGGSSLQASLICAGYNAGTDAGQIFGIAPGGSLWEEHNFCVSGSGSTILLGYLDDALQSRDHNFSKHFTEEEAIVLVTKLLRLSIARDGSSGGLVRLYVINRNGLEERTVYPSEHDPMKSGSGKKAGSTDQRETEQNYRNLKGLSDPIS